MSRAPTDERRDAGREVGAPGGDRLALALGIALATAGAGVPATATGQAQPAATGAAIDASTLAATGTADSQVDLPAPGIEELAEGLYVVAGHGPNLVARVTPAGVVVAGELTLAAEAVAALLDGVTDEPVRYFLRTQRHGNESMPLPAAWQSAKRVAPEPPERPPAVGSRNPAASPDLTFSRGLSLFLGEAELQLHHFAPAHTANDAVVLFPDLGVLYAGDLVVEGMPFIDYAAGGSSRGWVESLDGILALDFETVIPGTGPPLTKRDVQVFRDRFVTLRMRVMQLLYRDVPRAEALSLLRTTDLDWPLAPGGPFATGSFAALYDELAIEREEARTAGAAEPDAAAAGTQRR